MTIVDWILVGVLAAVYLVTAARAAMAAKRLGRRPLVWLAITICFTAIPAMIVLYRDAMRRHRQRLTEARAGNASAGSMFRCPHCQALIDPSELSGMPIQTCPRCHLHIEKANLA